MASLLRSLVRLGPAAVYDGEVAQAIEREVRTGGGVMAADDLRSYTPVHSAEPLLGHYRDIEIVGVPGASGGTTVIEALQILEGVDLRATGHNSAESLRYIAGALRLAFADRYAAMGDPEFVEPFEYLSSPEHAAKQRSTLLAGRPTPQTPQPALVGGPTETVQLTVVDAQRNVVSLTQTLLGWSGVLAPGTGFALNAAMRWFDPRPGQPNSIAGRKRPLTNMAPLILRRNGAPFLALGATGARRIIGALVQVIVNVVDHGLPLQAALDAPRIDASSDAVLVDSRLDPGVVADLEAFGYRCRRVADGFLASIFACPSGIWIDSSHLHAGASFWEDSAVAGL
jgi:gamma-glutamyltranspeptidase/glutathione hydrolase